MHRLILCVVIGLLPAAILGQTLELDYLGGCRVEGLDPKEYSLHRAEYFFDGPCDHPLSMALVGTRLYVTEHAIDDTQRNYTRYPVLHCFEIAE